MVKNCIRNFNTPVRELKQNRKELTKTMNKLSSGLKINTVADNSAGLSISEKMRAQIRGLRQAEENIEDGISLTQVADGGMNEIHDILQRVRELSVQAANDTNTDEDRIFIQMEVDEIISEIDRITDNTEFNEIKVLKGSGKVNEVGGNKETVVGGMPDWTKPIPNKLTQYTVGTFIKNDGTVIERKYAVGEIDFSKANSNNIQDLVGNGFYSTCCTCTEKYSIKFVNGKTNSKGSPNPIIEIDISNVKDAKSLVKAIDLQSQPYMTHFTQFGVDSKNPEKLYIIDPRIDAVPNPSKDLGIIGTGVVETTIVGNAAENSELNIQIGANSGDNLKIKLPDTTCDNLNITSISVESSNDAAESIKKIDNAINMVNKERSNMGAYENRLARCGNVASNSNDNLQASESRIRDTDMAESMINYLKNRILEQSSLAILSQVNSADSDIVKNLLSN